MPPIERTLEPPSGVTASARAESLRRRGLDEDGVRFCLAMHGLDRMIQAHAGRRHHVLVCCAPKSASTYLNRVLLAVTGFNDQRLEAFEGDNEQNIDFRWLPVFLAHDTVTRQHVRAARPNLELIDRLGLRPVVLVRDIHDTIVSCRDHLVGESRFGPITHVPAEFVRWSGDEQLWFVVRTIAPWFLSFVAGWEDASVDRHWITYERLVSDTPRVVREVLAHAGVETTDAAIDAAIERTGTTGVRFNQGRIGRGRTVLSRAQQEAIADLAAVYRGTCDFSRLGLP